MSTLSRPRRFQVIGPIVRWLHECVFAPTKAMAALALLVPLTAVSCGRPDGTPPVDTTGVTSEALASQAASQATASSISMNFNGAPIAAGSTIWFNSVVDLESPPNAVAHIVVSGGYITFNAKKVGYNLPVPDGVLTIDPSATHATTTFDATGKWETVVPPQAAGKAFITGLAYLVPANLPGDIHGVTWHASFTTDTSGLCFHWQWGAAVQSRFGHSHRESRVKASDDGHYSDNSDPAGTCEGFKDYVVPGGGGEGGGGEDYRGGHSDSRSVCPSLDKCQDLVTCPAPPPCRTQGVCQAATGTCTTPSAPNGSACTIANATASCQSGACALTACNAGYADCNGTLADGCETPNTTTSNCGTCGNACASGANSTAACVSGACALNCVAGFSNCDSNAANGCELATSADSSNCGGCGVVCQNHDTCVASSCGTLSCQAGYADCDKNPANGCEVTLATDVSSCGQCGHACSIPSASASCSGGACVMGACAAGHLNCDRLASDGCEVDATADVNNCGGCGQVCSLPNATPACSAGACAVSACNSGAADCDHKAADGCEVNTLTDIANCGGCGTVCAAAPNASGTCTAGACGIACGAGFANCDGNSANGCETPVSADVSNCGGCGVKCANAEGCVAGVCTTAVCQTGYADCNKSSADGCEVTLGTDSSNCGQCGSKCAFANAPASCSGGTCVMGACSAGYADCDGNPSNGCEVSTATDALNCGSCGGVCSLPNATAACAASACAVAVCNGGYANCDGNPANGCEVKTTSDVNNCGVCGNVCPGGANGSPTCVQSTCGIACTAGFADCDGNAANGCEVKTTSDVLNCGTCGTACQNEETCQSGACSATVCQAGFAKCDGNAANGCEVNASIDLNNCGGCGIVCAFANARAACSSGVCAIATCSAGFANCDGNQANGCEVATTTDSNNCGSCGAACLNQETCQTSACSAAVCQPGYGNCDGNAANGCEVNLNGEANNCGVCGKACAFANAGALCANGGCAMGPCAPGFMDCDGNPANGCEVNTQGDGSNCGACGVTCTNHDTCQSGACTSLVCQPGYADCNGVPADGCETSTQTDPSNCNACGNLCSYANASGQCAASGCAMGACNLGYADCDHSAANGCEVNTIADLNNCGGCGAACSLPNAAPACVGGSCAVAACNSGFADCNGVSTDGCEVSLTADVSNCGGCGHFCAHAPNSQPTCTPGRGCGVACAPGFADCNNNPADGCEILTERDTNNCGVCGRVCNTPNATPACLNGGACMVAACNPGFADCDGIPQNGCEVDLTKDVNNCGACGNVCPGGANASCANSACVVQCTSGSTSTPTVATSYRDMVLADLPFGYWRMEEVSIGQPATDQILPGHPGTYLNGITLSAPSASPLLGHAAHFDGADQAGATRIELSVFHPGDAITVEAWVRAEGPLKAYNAIVARWDGSYELDVTGALMGNFVVHNSAGAFALAQTPRPLVLGRWHHIAGVFAGGVATVYLDGLAGTPAVVGGVLANAGPGPVEIGATRVGEPQPQRFTWTGAIDEVAIYAKDLGANAIQRHFAAIAACIK